MEVNTITKEQLNKLVDAINTEFKAYFKSNKSNIDSLEKCFYVPEVYETEGLLVLNKEIFGKLPDEVQEKTQELIAGFTKVD